MVSGLHHSVSTQYRATTSDLLFKACWTLDLDLWTFLWILETVNYLLVKTIQNPVTNLAENTRKPFISLLLCFIIITYTGNNISCRSYTGPRCSLDLDLKWIFADLSWVFFSQISEGLPVSGSRGVISIQPWCPAFWSYHPGGAHKGRCAI